MNRHGNQTYTENVIWKAGGTTTVEALITYSNKTMLILSVFQYTCTFRGNTVIDRFKNSDPDETKTTLRLTKKKETSPKSTYNRGCLSH